MRVGSANGLGTEVLQLIYSAHMVPQYEAGWSVVRLVEGKLKFGASAAVSASIKSASIKIIPSWLGDTITTRFSINLSPLYDCTIPVLLFVPGASMHFQDKNELKLAIPKPNSAATFTWSTVHIYTNTFLKFWLPQLSSCWATGRKGSLLEEERGDSVGNLHCRYRLFHRNVWHKRNKRTAIHDITCFDWILVVCMLIQYSCIWIQVLHFFF